MGGGEKKKTELLNKQLGEGRRGKAPGGRGKRQGGSRTGGVSSAQGGIKGEQEPCEGQKGRKVASQQGLLVMK